MPVSNVSGPKKGGSSEPLEPPLATPLGWGKTTLVFRATLRGVPELHVASSMPQWRIFVTCCYF